MKKPLLKRIGRFLLSGWVAEGVRYALYFLLMELGAWYQVAALIAAVISSAVNFIIQKYWTFENKDRAVMRKQAIQFVITSIGFTLANAALLYVFVDIVQVPTMWAQVIVSNLLGIASWFISGWIFRNKAGKAP